MKVSEDARRGTGKCRTTRVARSTLSLLGTLPVPLSFLLLAGSGPPSEATRSKSEFSAQQAPVSGLVMAAGEVGSDHQAVPRDRAVEASIAFLVRQGWSLEGRQRQENGEVVNFHREDDRFELVVAPQKPTAETVKLLTRHLHYIPAKPMKWPRSGERRLLRAANWRRFAALALCTGRHLLALSGPTETELYEVAAEFMRAEGKAIAAREQLTVGVAGAESLLSLFIADGWEMEKRERLQDKESASLRRAGESAWYEIKRERSVDGARRAFDWFWMRIPVAPTRYPKLGHEAMLWASAGRGGSSLYFYWDRYCVALVGFPETEALQSARKLLRLLAAE